VIHARCAVLALLATCFGATAGAVEPATSTGMSELLVRGAEVYRERCSPCHGDRGRGDGILASVLAIRPRNYFSEPFKWGREPSDIVETIRVGRSGVMPAFEGALDAREMWAVANLVHLWATGAAAAPDPVSATR
jgi:cytochrome c oxidase cbb3-type subunit 3